MDKLKLTTFNVNKCLCKNTINHFGNGNFAMQPY